MYKRQARACTVLTKEAIQVEGKCAIVNKRKCTACGTCEDVCPAKAIAVNIEERVAVVNEALCKGCGAVSYTHLDVYKRQHPDNGNATPEDCAKTAKAVSEAVNVPLIVIGCGVEEKDAEIMPAVGEALNGKAALLGYATPNNYKTIAATCMVNGHSIIAASPLDINLAKQLNILITEMGLSADRIAIDSLVGALGRCV